MQNNIVIYIYIYTHMCVSVCVCVCVCYDDLECVYIFWNTLNIHTSKSGDFKTFKSRKWIQSETKE
jgi:hypothetical protein